MTTLTLDDARAWATTIFTAHGATPAAAASTARALIAAEADGLKGHGLSRIAPYVFRVLKRDCLDLPEKIYTTRHVSLSDVQRRHYNSLVREFRAPTALVLPVISKPNFVQPFIIIAHSTSEPSGFYRLMGWLNLSLALIASALLFVR